MSVLPDLSESVRIQTSCINRRTPNNTDLSNMKFFFFSCSDKRKLEVDRDDMVLPQLSREPDFFYHLALPCVASISKAI